MMDIEPNLLTNAISEVVDALKDDGRPNEPSSWGFNRYLSDVCGVPKVDSISAGWPKGGDVNAIYVRTSSKGASLDIDYSDESVTARVVADLYVKDANASRIWKYHDALIHYLQQWEFGQLTLGYTSRILTKKEGDAGNYISLSIDILVQAMTDRDNEARRVE